MSDPPEETPSASPAFPPTRWTLVIEAQRDGDPAAGPALAQLCQTYWYPLYAYARRQGRTREDAEDLTQSLFARLFDADAFSALNLSAEAGKLRSYLLTAMQRHLAGEWRKAQALKRGAGATPVSLDAEEADRLFKAEPATDATPESEFERTWAVAQLDAAFDRLRAECAARGKLAAFDALRDIFANPGRKVNFAAVGARIGLSEGNARVTAHRLRSRLRQLLREVVAETVGDHDEEIEAELAHLRAVLAR